MTQKQFKSIIEWQTKTFGKSTALSKIAHLTEEVQELITDLQNNSVGKKLEFADCFILLFGAAAADGMEYEDICNAIEEKMNINYKRNWGMPQKNGVINHIK